MRIIQTVGFPILNVDELFDTNGRICGIKISQESFTGVIYQFKIPIVYENNGVINEICVLMNEKEKVVDMNFDW